MNINRSLSLLVILIGLVLVSCAPAVPYDQMPGYAGGPDLYSNAQSQRQLAEQALRQAEMAEAAMTATAQAPIVGYTSTAAAVTMQAAQAQATSFAGQQTAVGAMTATAVWWTPTPHLDSTATVAALNAQNTMIANNLERDRLALDRETKNNEWNRLRGDLAILFVMAIVGMYAFAYIRRWSYMPATVDARGNVLPMINVVDGLATDIDRNPNFQSQLKSGIMRRLIETKLGLQPLLPAVTASRQDGTTERDQMVDLATRGLPGPTTENKERKQIAAQAMANQVSGANLDSHFKMLDVTGDGVIDETIITVLDQDWKDADKR
jgi:hypothetical protein